MTVIPAIIKNVFECLPNVSHKEENMAITSRIVVLRGTLLVVSFAAAAQDNKFGLKDEVSK